MREAQRSKTAGATWHVGHGRTRALNKGRGTWRPCGSWRTGRRGGTWNEGRGMAASDSPKLPRPLFLVPPRSGSTPPRSRAPCPLFPVECSAPPMFHVPCCTRRLRRRCFPHSTYSETARGSGQGTTRDDVFPRPTSQSADSLIVAPPSSGIRCSAVFCAGFLPNSPATRDLIPSMIS